MIWVIFAMVQVVVAVNTTKGMSKGMMGTKGKGKMARVRN